MGTRVAKASVKAKVAGNNLAPTGFTINLWVNSIPSIEIQCAPSKMQKGENTPTKVNVKKPSISDFSDLYRELANKAESLSEEGDVEISIDYGDFVSEIKLEGWILSSVGMSSVSATGAPYLSVVLMHPICKLTKFGSIYETVKSADVIPDSAKNASDFIEIVDKVYDGVSKGDNKFLKSPSSYPKTFRKKLGEEEFKPSTYLVYKGPKGFLSAGDGIDEDEAKAAKALKKCIASAIADMVIPSNGGSSTWDMIVSMSGALLLWITQDDDNNFTTKKLAIGPADPWRKQDVTLKDEFCSQTELQGMDPFRVTGVMCRKMGPYNDNISQGLYANGNKNKEEPVADILYVPDGTDTKSASGRIIKTSAPAILDAAYRKDAPHGKSISTGMSGVKNAQRYNGIIEKYCKAVYEMAATSMVKARAQMIIRFKDDDNKMILPGRTCKFMSGEKAIYYGYIMGVSHSMTTRGGCATTVSMSYVRPEENLKIGDKDAIKAGSGNAAYG